MGICKAGKCFVLVCELCQLVDDLDELSLNDFKSVAHNDDIGIVADVAACCAKVDYAVSLWAASAVGVNVCHNVVAHLFLLCGSHFVVDVFDICFKLVHLLLCDVQTELHLCSCKSDPKSAPGGSVLVGGELELHLLACITCAEWAFIAVCHNNLSFKVIKTQIIIP